MTRSNLLGGLSAVFLLTFGPHPAAAELIDQTNTGSAGGILSLTNGYAEGQSFRPALDQIDFIRFRFEVMPFTQELPITVDVRLHHGARTTPQIAQSAPVLLSGSGRLVREFRFASGVPLVPGELYTAIVRILAGTENWGMNCSNPAPYPHGQLIATWGDPQFYDTWFEEGIDDAVPALPATWGRLKSTYR